MTANVITYRGKSAMREIGKALALPEDMMDRYFKLFASGDFPHTIHLHEQGRLAGRPLIRAGMRKLRSTLLMLALQTMKVWLRCRPKLCARWPASLASLIIAMFPSTLSGIGAKTPVPTKTRLNTKPLKQVSMTMKAKTHQRVMCPMRLPF